jgi:hypothetical protein
LRASTAQISFGALFEKSKIKEHEERKSKRELASISIPISYRRRSHPLLNKQTTMLRRWNSEPMGHAGEEQSQPLTIPEQTVEITVSKDDTVLKSEKIPPDSSKHTTITFPTRDSDTSGMSEAPATSQRGPGFGRGIVADAKRTLGVHWIAEMRNFNQKTVAVSFFLYFACIAPAITFGAIYAKTTYNYIGAVEMLLATAWCGIIYALVGGQPMMINGGTGPVLAFVEILYKMSESLEIPFLTFNAWIGLWICFYMVIAAFTGLNRVIVYATRFTDEIFALLIASIFIINALGDPFAPVGVYYYFEADHPSHDKHQDDPGYSYRAAALLSLMVTLGTVWLAFTLRRVKFSPFLMSQAARNFVTDFAVVSSIVIMTVLAALLFEDVPLETLNVPDTFSPTFSCCTESCDSEWPEECPDQAAAYGQRPWLVDLGNLNGKGWVPLMAAGPAFLAFILVFLDNGITWHLVNGDTYKLKHGAAYNYDTLIIGVMIAINSLLGLPWLVAATVRSVNHVHALAEKTSDGKIVSVQETRLTNLFIHILVLASIFALDVLKLIPVPVLYGVFLFMGLVSLGTNTFWQRILMFFMQPSRYPLEPYTMHMKPKRMHLFTVIQLLLFVLLYTVKAIKTIAIAFPLIIALCIPVRLYLLPQIFTQEELIMVDGEDEDVKRWFSKLRLDETHHKIEDLHEEEEEEPHDESEPHDEGEEPHSDHGEEARDKLTPLPDLIASADEEEAKKPYVRKKRRKSVSAPSHMLFAEVSVPSATPPDIGLAIVDQQKKPPVEDIPPFQGERRPRQRRSKSVSCPPHMLFAEANKHLDSQYFFG